MLQVICFGVFINYLPFQSREKFLQKKSDLEDKYENELVNMNLNLKYVLSEDELWFRSWKVQLDSH